MATRPRWWLQLMVIGLPTLLAVSIFELGFYWVFETEDRFINNGIYATNPRGYFQPCGGNFCVDSAVDVFESCTAPADSTRHSVVFVGDSFTYGVGVFPADAFRNLINFSGFQRRTCAWPGNNIEQIEQNLLTAASLGRPALAVYGMVLNDLDNLTSFPDMVRDVEVTDPDIARTRVLDDFVNVRTMNFQAYLDERAGSLGPARVLLYSRTAAWLYRSYLLGRASRVTSQWYHQAYEPGPRLDQAFAAIERMNGASDRFLLVLFPLFVDLGNYPFAKEHSTIVEGLRRRHIEVLDLLDTFRNQDEEALIVHPTDRHPNEVAHRMAAEAIRERLRVLGWPPYASALVVGRPSTASN